MRCVKCRKEIIGQGNQMGTDVYCSLCFPDIQKDEIERKALISYIIDTYKIPKPTGMMFGQMKKMREKYTYKNMRLTLKYAFDVMGIRPETKYGLAIINYYHDDMLEYYKAIARKIKANKGVGYSEKKVVVKKPRENTYGKDKMIDMDKFN